MKYKVFIKQCGNPRRAAMIAEALARRSGITPDAIRSALTEKALCIKHGADSHEAMELKGEFEAAGAEVEFVPDEVPRFLGPVDVDKDGDFENVPGRILTEEEFMERLKYRMDIFTIRKDTRFRRIEAACLLAGIASGMWLTKQEIATVAGPDFYAKIPKEFTAKMVDAQQVSAALRPPRQAPKNKTTAAASNKRTLNNGHSTFSSRGHDVVGDPREHVTRTGVLGLISGKITGKSMASADIFGQGGFASNIDAIIQGTNGLKTGGEAGVGRKGETGIGYGPGVYGKMSDVSDLGVDNIIASLLPSIEGLKLARPEYKNDQLKITEPVIIPGVGVAVGGRSRASITRVVLQNIMVLRYAYNKRLREKPGLKGKITCKFAIDEFGKIVFCEMTESTMTDPLLEAEVVAKIRTWVFEKIDKLGDVTEVVYPFAFSQ